MFQFHNGTINTREGTTIHSKNRQFQFHNGTINTNVATRFQSRFLSFNSTTVQLIRHLLSSWVRLQQFQFHNGTINTGKQTTETYRLRKFQFHNGTINTSRWIGAWASVRGFNSTTVQLIPFLFVSSLVLTKFQFHNGTINTPTAERDDTSDNVSIPQRYN